MRPAGATAESYEITLMPRSMRRFSVGTSASGSLADTAMASTRCAISEFSTSICPSAVGVVGPVKMTSASSSRRGFVRALVNGIEEAIAQRFGHDADARARRLCGLTLAAAGSRGQRRHGARDEEFSFTLDAPLRDFRRSSSSHLRVYLGDDDLDARGAEVLELLGLARRRR